MDQVEINRPLSIGAVLQVLEQGGYETMKLQVHNDDDIWFELHFRVKYPTTKTEKKK